MGRQWVGSVHLHTKLAGDVVLEAGAFGVVPARQYGDRVAGDQLGQGQAHIAGPGGVGRRVVLGRVLDVVAELAQARGLGVECRVVELRQAGHGAGEVNSGHDESLRRMALRYWFGYGLRSIPQSTEIKERTEWGWHV